MNYDFAVGEAVTEYQTSDKGRKGFIAGIGVGSSLKKVIGGIITTQEHYYHYKVIENYYDRQQRIEKYEELTYIRGDKIKPRRIVLIEKTQV